MLLRDEFIISSHERYVDNLNAISNQLKGFYWYFLASIGSLGLAYKYILGRLSSYEVNLSNAGHIIANTNIFHGTETNFGLSNGVISTTFKTVDASVTQINYFWMVLVVCLIGNIIFWKISEYAISHGFLFRYIQYRAAKMETHAYEDNYDDLRQSISDPTSIEKFLTNAQVGNVNNHILVSNETRLKIDFFLPDQFNPLYWASIWMIVINSFIAGFLTYHQIQAFDLLRTSLIYAAISMPLIWKLWDYYLYRLKSYVSVYTDYIFVDKSGSDFLKFPRYWYFVLLASAFAIFIYCIFWREFDWVNLALLVFVAYYTPLILGGFLIHFLRTISHVTETIGARDIFKPIVRQTYPNLFEIDCSDFWRGVVLLAMVI